MRVFAAFLLLVITAVAADPSKTEAVKDRKARLARVESSPPIMSPEEAFRSYDEAMRAGEWVRGAQFLHEDALRGLKAKTLRVLRDAPRSRVSKFLKSAGINSTHDLQRTPPHAFFEAVMRDAELVKKYVDQIRDDPPESITAREDNETAEILVKFKSGREVTFTAHVVTNNLVRNWRMVIIPSFD